MSPAFQKALLQWYDRVRRDLPWRVSKGQSTNPYHVLVSESMLQQTQVVTVVPYFNRFIERFPTIHVLAVADEQDVLRLWQGLGYYSRARNLLKCARMVVEKFAGRIPSTVVELLELPGIGRYTAGAIASLAYEVRAPIVDGNVIRVICRLDRIESDPREKPIIEHLWRRAQEILPHKRPGDFNSALMELGATVCVPGKPVCPLCPLRRCCQSHADGVQESIPPARQRKGTVMEKRIVFCIFNRNKWMIEQRPANGRWAGMWQFVTVVDTESVDPVTLLRRSRSVNVTGLHQLGEFTHVLTHRRYTFRVFRCEWKKGLPSGYQWATLAQTECHPMPRPHLKIRAMLESSK